MHCYCKDEFDWFMKMLKKGDCFSYWEDVAEFIDDGFLELRYMNKRFGYLFCLITLSLRKTVKSFMNK